MNTKEKGEFEVMKNEIKHIKSDVTEIKDTLKAHVDWEKDKYDDLDAKYVHRSEWETFQSSQEKTKNKLWELFISLAPWLAMAIVIGSLKLTGVL